MPQKTFLTANWKNLLMLNYEISPEILQKYVPPKTELDFWDGKCFASIVGFQFFETKVLGIKFPFHTNFEEINLRFYVRYNENNIWKRGVVFIKEIVPKFMITTIANLLYNENYATHQCRHTFEKTDNQLLVKYEWKTSTGWNFIEAKAESKTEAIKDGSEEEFITEHYWGYAKANESQTTEYQVAHPRWNIHRVNDFNLKIDFKNLYGNEFSFLETAKPSSVFLAEGSEISVYGGKRL